MNEKQIEEFKRIAEEKGIVMVTATQLQNPKRNSFVNWQKSCDEVEKANRFISIDYVDRIKK